MKLSGKMCLKIILKVKTTQDFALSLEDTFFEKQQKGRGRGGWGWGAGVKLTPPVVLGLSLSVN